jgi:hypothetical protein
MNDRHAAHLLAAGGRADAGTTLEESEVSFATIAAAVAAGRRRLRAFGPLDGADVAAGRRHYSWGAVRGRER